MNGSVRTALGDLSPAELGRTDYHEHLFQASPLLAGEELDDEEKSGREAGFLHEAGIDAMVDATPMGLGRRPEAVARISARTSLAVVLTTGVHREAHYPDSHWVRDLDGPGLERRLLRDLEEAMAVRDGPDAEEPARAPDGTAIRAGMLKAGIGYWSISSFEHRTLAAVASAHGATGAPVMVHLEHGSAAHEVLDLLAGGGVGAGRVVLAHVDRNPDDGLLAELADRGAYLGFDGMARAREWPDSVLVECIVQLVRRGYESRIVLGGDVARRSRYVAYGGMPGLAYLPLRFLPRLAEALSARSYAAVVGANAARLLTWASVE